MGDPREPNDISGVEDSRRSTGFLGVSVRRVGNRQVTYHVPPLRSPGKVFRTPFPNAYTTISQDKVLQRILDDWRATNKERARFHNYEEWLAYYNELKASEHEDRPRK